MINTRGKITTFDEPYAMPVQVVLGAAVAADVVDHRLQMIMADQHRMPRPTAVAGPDERRRVGPFDDPPDHGGTDIGQVDQLHDNRIGRVRERGGQPGPQGGAHPVSPVGGLDDAHLKAEAGGFVLDQGPRLVGGRAEHHDDVGTPTLEENHQ